MTDLVCYACGGTADLGERQRCTCGEPLWLATDPSGFDWADLPDAPGLWRYQTLLPVEEPTGLAAAAGGTPLVRTPRLDSYAGCRTHLKDEGQNPTGSFKDRGSAVGVTHVARGSGEPADVREDASAAVGTVSHGNMAMSMAAHAASADVECVVLVPEDVPAARLRIIDQYGPRVVRVAGDYGRLYHESLAFGPRLGLAFVNSDSPLRVAGQKTTVLEVLERFAPAVPDAIVLPVSSGGHASAAWKAIRELDEAGLLASIPRLYLVQAAACAPIAAADEAGATEVTPVDGEETIAYSIANADPPSGTRALAAARDTGGAAIAVSDEEIRDANARLADRAGVSAEPASATTLAGARRLSREGELDEHDDIVLVVTGTGFKETTGMGEPPDPPTVALADLEATLAEQRSHEPAE